MIQDTSRPSYVLFLTDGLPTAGETQRAGDRRELPQGQRAPGPGLLLRRRLRRQRPAARPAQRRQQRDQRVRQARRGHRDARRPVLLQDDQPRPGRHPPRARGHRRQPDLSPRPPRPVRGRPDRLGRPLSAVGPDDDPDHAARSATSAGSFEFPAELAGPYRGSSHDFVERLWAVRRVGDLIDQIDLHGQNKELVDELVVAQHRSTAS